MKKLMTAFILSAGLGSCAVPSFAQAHGYNHHGYWHHRGGPSPWVWVAPTIVGGVIGYEIARQQPPVVVQQPVIVQQPTVAVQSQNCSPWTEVQNADGSITRTRTCTN